MLVSNVSFSSSVRSNANTTNYNCPGCGKRKANDFTSMDTYVKNFETDIEADNQNLRKALRFACKIIAANE